MLEVLFFGTFSGSHQKQMANLLAGTYTNIIATNTQTWNFNTNKIFSQWPLFFGEAQHCHFYRKAIAHCLEWICEFHLHAIHRLAVLRPIDAFFPFFKMDDLVARTNFGATSLVPSKTYSVVLSVEMISSGQMGTTWVPNDAETVSTNLWVGFDSMFSSALGSRSSFDTGMKWVYTINTRLQIGVQSECWCWALSARLSASESRVLEQAIDDC